MKIIEFYRNKYPLEKLLPDLDEKDIQDIVNNHGYTIEADEITKKHGMTNFVNTADAMVFYAMGYEAAQKRIKEILEPLKT
jgi:hypothetical protein